MELLTIPKIDPEHDIAVLQYTGGTTGLQRGHAHAPEYFGQYRNVRRLDVRCEGRR